MVGLRSEIVSKGLSTVLDDQQRSAYVAITLLSRPFRTDIYSTGTPCFSRGRVAVKKTEKLFIIFNSFHFNISYVFCVCFRVFGVDIYSSKNIIIIIIYHPRRTVLVVFIHFYNNFFLKSIIHKKAKSFHFDSF